MGREEKTGRKFRGMPPVPSYSMETDLSHGEMRARRRAVEQRLCPLVGTRQGDHQLNRFSASYLILSRTRPTLVAPCPPPRLGRHRARVCTRRYLWTVQAARPACTVTVFHHLRADASYLPRAPPLPLRCAVPSYSSRGSPEDDEQRSDKYSERIQREFAA